jgi:hypothetical protein
MTSRRAPVLSAFLATLPLACTTAPMSTTVVMDTAKTTDAMVARAGDDHCLKDNAADGPLMVDVNRVLDHQVSRDRAARQLTERFRFEGLEVMTTVAGCSHHGMSLTLQGPGLPLDDTLALASLLERLPLEEVMVYVNALRMPDDCDQDRPGSRVLRCRDAHVTLTWTTSGAALVYDFPL